jgi:hypothetical protein
VVVDVVAVVAADTAAVVEVDGADSCVDFCRNAYFQKLLLLTGKSIFTPLRAFTPNAAALSLACVLCLTSSWVTAVRCSEPSRCVCSAVASCRLTGFFFV